MSHDHAPHDHDLKDVSGRRIVIALALNVALTITQIIGGLLSGSLALLSDAAHNGSDAAALGIAWGAQKLARRPADHQYTFGYERAKAIGALINLTTLYVIALYLIYEGISRLIHPPEVQGMIMLIVGGIAFVEDLLSVLVLWKSTKGNVNVKAAAIHLIGDTVATVGVVLSGALILWKGIVWIDPVITLAIAVYIIIHASMEMRKVTGLLMERAPDDLDLHALADASREVPGVLDIRHVHVWRLDESRTAMEAVVVVNADLRMEAVEEIKTRLRRVLAHDFGVAHAVFETEAPNPDGDAGLIAVE
jgi:cobalt-zinc-cadmium efflux system protein